MKLTPFLLVLLLPCPLRAEEGARDIIARAIKAHGEKRAARPQCTLKLKGTFFADGKPIPHSGSSTLHGMDRSRVEIESEGAVFVAVLNKDTGWIRENNATRDMTEAERADAADDAYTDWVCSLVPLRGGGFKLTRVDDARLGKRRAHSVRVQREGRRDILLFFDVDTGLLIRKSFTRNGPNGQPVRYETDYGDFKEFDSIKVATRLVTYRDGKKRMENVVEEARFAAEADDKTFAKP